MSMLTFTVYGKPVPQGSMKAFVPPGMNRPIVTSDNEKLRPWRNEMVGVILNAMEAKGFTRCGKNVPIKVDATFYFAENKDGKQPRIGTTVYKPTAPDVDKLLRALLDSMKGLIYVDDQQVTDVVIRKRANSPARVEVTVEDIACEIPKRKREAALPPGRLFEYKPIRDKDIPF